MLSDKSAFLLLHSESKVLFIYFVNVTDSSAPAGASVKKVICISAFTLNLYIPLYINIKLSSCAPLAYVA